MYALLATYIYIFLRWKAFSLTPYRYGNKFDPQMVKEGIINLQTIFLYTQFAYHKSHGRVNKKLYITGS